MAHKRKGKREVRKPPVKREERSGRTKVFFVILVAFALVLVPIALILSSQQDESEPNQPVFEISFPRDEGQHNESVEFWKVDFLLHNQAGDRFDINVDYYLHEDAFQERVVTVTDEDNVSGTEFFHRVHQGSLGIGYEKLNLTFDSSLGSDSWFGEYSGLFEYTYQGEVVDSGDEVYYLDLQMTAMKDPLLLGDKGIVLLKSNGDAIGTFKGYLITRLDISGTLRLRGATYVVEGYAWIEHEWGALSVRFIEEFRLHLSTASELFILKLYDNDDTTLIEQMVYYSKPDGEVIELDPGEFELENLRYRIDPRFIPSLERCYPSEWRFESASLDTEIVFHSARLDQIEKYHWEGSLSISGTIDGIIGTGRGFATMNHVYYSRPQFVAFYKDDSIPSDLYANISNGIPMDNATAYYQVNGGSWSSVPMSNIGGDLWRAHILVIIGDDVEAYVEAYDLAGKKVTSDHLIWTV